MNAHRSPISHPSHAWLGLIFLSVTMATGCCKKGEDGSQANPATAAPAKAEDGSSWAGVYIRYGEAVRQNGKKIPSPTSAGRASLTMTAGTATYLVEYGPNLANKIT